MKTIKPVRNSPQTIETIIHSFESYALADIEYAKERPIAAFILSICFIEQLSTFLYEFHSDDNKKSERFLSEYMPEYMNINLYHKARHTLVHNYSSRGQFDIDNRGRNEDVPYLKIGETIHINTNVFIYYLKMAFQKAKKVLVESKEWEGNFTPYKNALENSRYYPVLVDTK